MNIFQSIDSRQGTIFWQIYLQAKKSASRSKLLETLWTEDMIMRGKIEMIDRDIYRDNRQGGRCTERKTETEAGYDRSPVILLISIINHSHVIKFAPWLPTNHNLKVMGEEKEGTIHGSEITTWVSLSFNLQNINTLRHGT